MAYWLCITNEENWKVIKERSIWGVPERHKNVIARVKPGDKLLIYVKQKKTKDEVIEPRIVAVYEAKSKSFKDLKKVFSSKGMRYSNEVFPWRIKLKPVKIFDKPVEFKPLIPKLKFIKNKQKWAGHLMGKAMRELPKEDFRLILEKFSEK